MAVSLFLHSIRGLPSVSSRGIGGSIHRLYGNLIPAGDTCGQGGLGPGPLKDL